MKAELKKPINLRRVNKKTCCCWNGVSCEKSFKLKRHDFSTLMKLLHGCSNIVEQPWMYFRVSALIGKCTSDSDQASKILYNPSTVLLPFSIRGTQRLVYWVFDSVFPREHHIRRPSSYPCMFHRERNSMDGTLVKHRNPTLTRMKRIGVSKPGFESGKPSWNQGATHQLCMQVSETKFSNQSIAINGLSCFLCLVPGSINVDNAILLCKNHVARCTKKHPKSTASPVHL